jgi:hypothetical protein
MRILAFVAALGVFACGPELVPDPEPDLGEQCIKRENKRTREQDIIDKAELERVRMAERMKQAAEQWSRDPSGSGTEDDPLAVSGAMKPGERWYWNPRSEGQATVVDTSECADVVTWFNPAAQPGGGSWLAVYWCNTSEFDFVSCSLLGGKVLNGDSIVSMDMLYWPGTAWTALDLESFGEGNLPHAELYCSRVNGS